MFSLRLKLVAFSFLSALADPIKFIFRENSRIVTATVRYFPFRYSNSHRISAPLRFIGRLGSGGVVGRLVFGIGVSASYSEQFSRKIASIINYIP